MRSMLGSVKNWCKITKIELILILFQEQKKRPEWLMPQQARGREE